MEKTMEVHVPLLNSQTFTIRDTQVADLSALVALEQRCFATDRLSKRSFSYWIKAKHRVFMVVQQDDQIIGYGLVIMRKGTRLARLYSIAIDKNIEGKGIGRQLMLALETQTVAAGKLFLRLEVEKTNKRAIGLYESMGYKIFGDYAHYYENNGDAFRMQKPIRQAAKHNQLPSYPWYAQTTDFTCGPAALMMAMASLSEQTVMEQPLEFDLWREATTIFMMAGHGGCHPLGLALAAEKRGFKVKVYINQPLPLFTSGVRQPVKKHTVEVIEQQFESRAQQQNIPVLYADFDLNALKDALESGSKVLSLISTYQMDGYKVPHWVAITAIDEECLYLHDPSVPEQHAAGFDCQHIPVALDDFIKLSSYGKTKLCTALVISKANFKE
ncbi:GNAT family N-acetyltransferase/peptidase C39 family protein [Paraglaciecola arctica]|uniref:Acetyltransferase, GNAT family n=1 Tax=Paraglaciecola arctica BSs20135 TaxID=493475 RepID=K6YCT3_9ALTE|nr:GNAT family N-acetyltransferase/peptidase C39 family protein [Paraglaciecola arctica]GAC21751.1 acetyltransferase, GNAT family [Paraglaciecola arctica BSs20135]